MKLSRLIFIVAIVIVGFWVLSLLFKAAAWLINGLIYVAAFVVIVGLISAYISSRQAPKKSIEKSNVIDVDEK